nr:MAG TPA: TerY-C metal binding domain [Caudoviricetes sp.]
MKTCAWCGADGRCQQEYLVQRRKNRLPCKYPLKNCKAYILELIHRHTNNTKQVEI